MKKQIFIPILLILTLFTLMTFASAEEPTQVNFTQDSYGGLNYDTYILGFDGDGCVFTSRLTNKYNNCGLGTGDLNGWDRDATFVEATGEWYAVSRHSVHSGQVARIDHGYNETQEIYTGFSGAYVITDDEQYIYIGFSDGSVKKYDFNMNYVEQVKGNRGTNYYVESSGLEYDNHYNAFLENAGGFKIYTSSFIQYGETHTLVIGGQSLIWNGTHAGVKYTNSCFPSCSQGIRYYDIIGIGAADPNFVLPPVNVAATSSIYQGLNTIDLTVGTTSLLPLSHARDGFYEYILSEQWIDNGGDPNLISYNQQVISYFSSDYVTSGTICGLAGTTDDDGFDLEFLGMYGNYFLVRSDDNAIYQLGAVSCDHVATRYLSGVTSAGDLKVVGDQLYVLSGEGRILVYTINKNLEGIISYVYQYEFGVNENIAFENSYITGEGNFLFILDANNLKIYKYDTLGTYVTAFDVEEWAYASHPRDLYFYQNSLYLIAYEEQLAQQYNLLPSGVDGYIELGGVKYSTESYCIDDTLRCSSTSFTVQSNGEVLSTCGVLEETCAQEGANSGCINDVNDAGVLTGECSEVSCDNECPINNVKTCNGLNTYTECGYIDTDVCLDVSAVSTCSIGQVCVTDGIYSGCEAQATTPNLVTELIVTKDIKSTNSVPSQVGDTYYLSSPFTTAFLGFNVDTTPIAPEYSSSIQNYVEMEILKDYITTTENWDGDTVSTHVDTYGRKHLELTYGQVNRDIPTTTSNKRIVYDIMGDEGTDKSRELRVTITDDFNNTIDELNFYYDKTTKDLTISRSINGVVQSAIFTDVNTNELYNVNVEITLIEDIDTLTYAFTIIRDVQNELIPYRYFTKPYGYIQSAAGDPKNIEFETLLEDWAIFGVEVYDIPDFNGYNSVDENNELQEKYTFTGTGCTINRIYANQYAIPTFHFYDEFEICVTEVGGVVDNDLEDEEKSSTGQSDLEVLFGTTFSTNDKALISVSLISIIFGLFYLVYRETKNGFVVGAGVVVSALFMFYFTLIGYLPAWLIIVLIILASIFVAKMIGNTFAR